MMIGTLLFVNVILLLAVFYLWKKRYDGTTTKRDKNLARLEEVIRNAELTNGGFFRSLELVQKNLESLLLRAEDAERRLRTLMLQPGSDKKDQYAAAALLLGEGQQPDRVASMLKLPLPQVQTVRALQKMTSADHKAATRRRRDEEAQEQEPQARKKCPAPREKIAVRPNSLAGVVKKGPSGAGPVQTHRSRLAGITA